MAAADEDAEARRAQPIDKVILGDTKVKEKRHLPMGYVSHVRFFS
jgi:hypothetical protein